MALVPTAMLALPPVETVYLNNGDVYFGYIQEYNVETDKVTFVAEKGVYHLNASEFNTLDKNTKEMTTKPIKETAEFVRFFDETPKALAAIGNPETVKVYDLTGEAKSKWGPRVILAKKDDIGGATILTVNESTKTFEYSQMDSITREPLPQVDFSANGTRLKKPGLKDKIVLNSGNEFIGINTLTIPGEEFEMVMEGSTKPLHMSLDEMSKKGKQCIDTNHDFIYNSPLLTDIKYKKNGAIQNITGVLVMDDYDNGTTEIYPLDGTENVEITSDDIISTVSRRNPDFGKERQKPVATEAASDIAGPSVGVIAEKSQPEPIAAVAESKKADPFAGAKKVILEELNDINDKEGKNLKIWADDSKRGTGKWTLDEEDMAAANRVKLKTSRTLVFEFDTPESPNLQLYKLSKNEMTGKMQFSYNDLSQNSAFVKEMKGKSFDAEDLGEGHSAVRFNNITPNSYYLVYEKDVNMFYLIHTIE